MQKKSSALARLFTESSRYWGGLSLTLLVTLFAGVFKVAADRLFSLLLDAGLLGERQKMIQIAIGLLVLLFVEIGRAVLQDKIGYSTFNKIMSAFSLRVFTVLCKGDMETLETMHAQVI